MASRIIFITGTDTGVGKTVLTGLLVQHSRRRGIPVVALKPFCSGGREDAELLHALQGGRRTMEEINPYYFREALAPLIAARKVKRRITLAVASQRIRTVTDAAEGSVLIEGAGGLLAPLGENFNALDLIKALHCEVVVVAANRLGTINHTLLTLEVLRHSQLRAERVVMMDCQPRKNADVSTSSNPAALRELLKPTRVFRIPYLGPNASSPKGVARADVKVGAVLKAILDR
jgi:dethiobiotin synthetase